MTNFKLSSPFVLSVLAFFAVACLPETVVHPKATEKQATEKQATEDLDVAKAIRDNLTEEEAVVLNLAGSRKGVGSVKTSINNQQESIETKKKRLENVLKARDLLRAVRSLSAQNVVEAKPKCAKITEAVTFLTNTNSPVRPFDGLRLSFRHALKNERDQLLQKVKVESCRKVTIIVKRLPDNASVPQEAADAPVPTSDSADQ